MPIADNYQQWFSYDHVTDPILALKKAEQLNTKIACKSGTLEDVRRFKQLLDDSIAQLEQTAGELEDLIVENNS